MKVIRISGPRLVMVDDRDFERLNQFRWHWVKPRHKNGSGYAARIELLEGRNGPRIRIFMHNEILPPKEGFETDHRNGDGLDNQRDNLRHSTRSQQCMNRGRRSTSLSPYKGITKANTTEPKWMAQIQTKGKHFHLGTFVLPEDAAMAYDIAAHRLFGIHARTNFGMWGEPTC